MAEALAAVLARGDVWRGNALAYPPLGGVDTGFPALDAVLPGRGWPRGCMTECLLADAGVGEMSLFLPALALCSRRGWVALVAPPFLPTASALARAGINLECVVVIDAPESAARSIEQLLLSRGFELVLGWLPDDVSHAALRRLQVASEGSEATAVIFRPAPAAARSSPAPLRLQVAPAADGLALELRVIKRRGGALTRPLRLVCPRPGRRYRVVAGPAFSPVAPGSPVLSCQG